MESYDNGMQKPEVALPKVVVRVISPMVEIPENQMPEVVWRDPSAAAAIESAICNLVVQVRIRGSGLVDIERLSRTHVNTPIDSSG